MYSPESPPQVDTHYIHPEKRSHKRKITDVC